MVAVIVAGSLAMSTSRMRQGNDRADRMLAIQLAESELQLQATRMQASTDWRTSLANNEFSAWRELLGGSVRHRFFDGDHSLNDDNFDGVTLTVHSRVNQAEAALSVDLVNAQQPLSWLSYCVTAKEELQINDAGNVASALPVQVGYDCTSNSTCILVTPRLEYLDELSVVVRGDVGSSSIEAPPSDIIKLYSGIGTEIDIYSIPEIDGDRIIENVVISSTHNPYASNMSSEAIYLIDGKDEDVIIRNCRIECTLVVTDYETLTVTDSVVWNSLNGDRPAILTNDDIAFVFMTTKLSESTQNTNFNPSHTPSRGGVSNATTLDSYPTTIRGIVYSEQDIYITPMVGDERLTFFGSLYANSVYVTGRLNVLEEPSLSSNPPPGFRDPTKMKFFERSMRRVATPSILD